MCPGPRGQGLAPNKVWNAETLDGFLISPMKYIPGTRMPFAGIPNAQDRADLIAYLAKAAR